MLVARELSVGLYYPHTPRVQHCENKADLVQNWNVCGATNRDQHSNFSYNDCRDLSICHILEVDEFPFLIYKRVKRGQRDCGQTVDMVFVVSVFLSLLFI